MKHSTYNILPFLFILCYHFSFSQIGIIIVKLDLPEKEIFTKLNFAFIENIMEGECNAFTDKRFAVPFARERINAVIKKHRLIKRNIQKLHCIIQWDVKKQEGVLMGYAPAYRWCLGYAYYYVPAGIHAKLDSSTSRILRESCKREMVKKSNQSLVKTKAENRSIREVKFSSYSGIRQFPLKGLPTYLAHNFKEDILSFYQDPELTKALELGEIKKLAEEGLSQPKIRKTFLYESWTDTVTDAGYTLQLNTKAIGLRLTEKTILWADYKEVNFISDSDKKVDGYSAFEVYKLYFESAFCKRVKMDILRK